MFSNKIHEHISKTLCKINYTNVEQIDEDLNTLYIKCRNSTENEDIYMNIYKYGQLSRINALFYDEKMIYLLNQVK